MNFKAFRDDFGQRIEVRHWIAWQLTKLAYKIHHCDFGTHIRVHDPDGALIVELGINGDCWGGGLWSSSFPSSERGYTVTDTGGMLFDKPDPECHRMVIPEKVFDLAPYCECCFKDWPCPDAQEETSHDSTVDH